jgi:hypothetical protein
MTNQLRRRMAPRNPHQDTTLGIRCSSGIRGTVPIGAPRTSRSRRRKRAWWCWRACATARQKESHRKQPHDVSLAAPRTNVAAARVPSHEQVRTVPASSPAHLLNTTARPQSASPRGLKDRGLSRTSRAKEAGGMSPSARDKRAPTDLHGPEVTTPTSGVDGNDWRDRTLTMTPKGIAGGDDAFNCPRVGSASRDALDADITTPSMRSCMPSLRTTLPSRRSLHTSRLHRPSSRLHPLRPPRSRDPTSMHSPG